MAHFLDADRKTAFLLPPSMEDWLPEGHLARFIVEVIEQLDLSRLVQQYAGRGYKAYHPATLLAILVYGYANGVFSSRKLEQATYDSVAFRYLAAGSHPDHDTLATFRRRFLGELQNLFVQVLELAQEMKLLQVGRVCLDGTKIHANASKHQALSHGLHPGGIFRQGVRFTMPLPPVRMMLFPSHSNERGDAQCFTRFDILCAAVAGVSHQSFYRPQCGRLSL